MVTHTIVFPGRFQPISNAHVNRVKWLLGKFPSSQVVIVLGDMVRLNRMNFLTASERIEIFNKLFMGTPNVKIVKVRACPDEAKWARNVLSVVPNADCVASDNPFAYEPLCACGLEWIRYSPDGCRCSEFRHLPFEEWRTYVPDEEWEMLMSLKITQRIANLPSGDRYQFDCKQDTVDSWAK